MKRAFHHVVWMLRRDRTVFIVNALLWAALSGVFWSFPDVLHFLPLFLLTCLVALIWMRALRMDGAVGTDVFWRSRPMSPRAIMAGQFLYLLVLLFLGPVASWLLVGARLDFTAGQWLQSLRQYAVLIVPMLVLAGIATAVRSRTALVVLVAVLFLTLTGGFFAALADTPSGPGSSVTSSFIVWLLALGGSALWEANLRLSRWRRHALVMLISAIFLLPRLLREERPQAEMLPLQRLTMVPGNMEPRPQGTAFGDFLLTGTKPGQYAVEEWKRSDFFAQKGFLQQPGIAALAIHFPDGVRWYRDPDLAGPALFPKAVTYPPAWRTVPPGPAARTGYLGELRLLARLPLSGGEEARDGLRVRLDPVEVDGESLDCQLRLWRYADTTQSALDGSELLFVLHVPVHQFAVLLKAPADRGVPFFLHCTARPCNLTTSLPIAEALLGHRMDAASLRGATLSILQDQCVSRFTAEFKGTP